MFKKFIINLTRKNTKVSTAASVKKKIKIGNIEILEPRQIIYDILKYKNSGTVLDLGAGFGRHSVFLSYKGFTATAVEKEEARLTRLKVNAEKLRVDITTICSSIQSFEPKEKYDVVINTMVLHYLSKNEVPEIIKKMQQCTNSNGLNVISVYTDKNPKGLRDYLFQQKELSNFYTDWKILQYDESLGSTLENPKDGGPPRRWSAKIIAQNIKK